MNAWAFGGGIIRNGALNGKDTADDDRKGLLREWCSTISGAVSSWGAADSERPGPGIGPNGLTALEQTFAPAIISTISDAQMVRHE